MKSKVIICIYLMCSTALFSFGQATKSTEQVQQLWFGFFNQTRISNKWGTWTDLHLRTKEDFTNNFSQAIIRLGLTYYLNDATKLTAGYAYINNFPADAHKEIS